MYAVGLELGLQCCPQPGAFPAVSPTCVTAQNETGQSLGLLCGLPDALYCAQFRRPSDCWLPVAGRSGSVPSLVNPRSALSSSAWQGSDLEAFRPELWGFIDCES